MEPVCTTDSIISDAERDAGVICKTEAVETIFVDRGGDILLVTFNEMGLVANGRDYWAASPAAKLKISTIGFVTRGPNWFPRDPMMLCIDATLKAISGRNFRIVTFGLSQGGYAAVKYSRLLSATASICFSPQISIDPDDIADSRFNKYYRSNWNAGMAITAGDVAGDVFLFYDPFDAKDADHCRRIRSVVAEPRYHEVLLPYIGHSTAKPFAGSAYLRRLLDACLACDMPGLRALYKEVKPRAPSRPFLIANAAVRLHPRIALQIVEQKSHLVPDLPWGALRERIERRTGATAPGLPVGEQCEDVPAETRCIKGFNLPSRSEPIRNMSNYAYPILVSVLLIYALVGVFAGLTEWRLKKLRWKTLAPDTCRRYLMSRGWSEPFRNDAFPKLQKGDLQIALTCTLTAPVSTGAVLSAVDSSLDSRNHLVVFTLVPPPESVVAEMLGRQISVIHYKRMDRLDDILRADAVIMEQHREQAKSLLTRSLQPPMAAALLPQTSPQTAAGKGGAGDVLIAETELVQCFFRDRGSEKVMIAFSDSWHKGREGRLLPRVDLEMLGYSIIDFVATEPNWFPAEDMMALLPAVQRVLERFALRITFGFSQGGYGALKFSAALRANISIAFSPQFSIDPRIVKGDRFNQHFLSHRNVGMGLEADDCVCPTYVFYDPFDKMDKQQVDFIGASIQIQQVPMPFFGHGTARVFSAPDRLVELLAASVAGDVAALHRIARQSRQDNRDRAYLLALHLTERNPARALNIAEKYRAEWSQNKQADFCYYLSLGGATDAALRWSERLAKDNPKSESIQGCAAMVAMRASELGMASRLIELALELNPGNAKWKWVQRQIQTLKGKKITDGSVELSGSLLGG